MLSAIEPVDKSVIQSLPCGANDYVTKPFDPVTLKACASTFGGDLFESYYKEVSTMHLQGIMSVEELMISQKLRLLQKAFRQNNNAILVLLGIATSIFATCFTAIATTASGLRLLLC